MLLKNIYKADIDRNINGVIKVGQDDENSIIQELSEYIITKELRRHFNTFLNNYERSLEQPTDKIGVWISGFFGSGKSHFLKILSYLLSNKTVGGKKAVEYFADKIDDPMMFAQLENCVKVPTDTILFNIDIKGGEDKNRTSIMRTFARVFYEHQGFYGQNLKTVQFEKFITKMGKAEKFKERFARIYGDTWENARSEFFFLEDEMVAAMCESLGMSETAARNWFNNDNDVELSIESLVKDIKEYIDSKGKDYRLLFMVDEVGQYIGSDSDLMLNLQSLVEEIGTKCGGRVWVMVTSQEAIDSIIKINGDDFSKIQGRFNTRLSLSSSSVDEIIKKRLLVKNEAGERLIRAMYEKNAQAIKNLISFDKNTTISDMKGYSGEDEFAESYPFVPYQFRLMQNVLSQVRKHGNTGKHESEGERSMLAGFQEAAQAIEDRDEYALVPFYLFYNTMHSFLNSSIKRVIDRCEDAANKNNGIEPYDVNILKLLYLIRYVEDVKANVENICVLMADDIRTDKVSARQDIQNSLDRLVSQNYVSRAGNTYTFLTDDEQDIAREIRNTPVDSADITKAISDIIFGKLFVSKKFKYGKYDFPFDQRIDETVIGQPMGAIALHFITVASENYSPDDYGFKMMSGNRNEVLVVLSDSQPYFKELENAMQIRRYVKGRNVTQLPEMIQNIIRGRQQQASAHEKRAAELIEAAISEGRIYVAGERITLKTASVKDRIERAMSMLVENVYTGLGLIGKNFDGDADILKILSGDGQTSIEGVGSPNSEAAKEIMQHLDNQKKRGLPTSMGDIQRRYSAMPYGWREVDIAAVVAELIASQKLTLKYSGAVIQPSNKKMPDYLRRRNEVDKAMISFRVAPPTALINKARNFLSEYFDCTLGAVPDDEDGIIGYIIEKFETVRDDLKKLIAKEYISAGYPGKSVAEEGVKLCGELLAQKNDNISLLQKMVDMQDELLDNADDIAEVKEFFAEQRGKFDSARVTAEQVKEEKVYFQTDDEVLSAAAAIREILEMKQPYRRIKELPPLCQRISDVYQRLLECKREEMICEINSAMAEIHEKAGIKQTDISDRADGALTEKRRAAEKAERLTTFDAMRIQISDIRQQYMRKLMAADKPEANAVTMSRGAVCHSMKLQSEADIEEYVAEIKKTLMEKLSGHDELHII